MGMEQAPGGKQNKKTEVPWRSQKNRAAGMFQASSLGDAAEQAKGKPVDMEAAKQEIRKHRQISPLQELRDKARTQREKEWLRYRKSWRTVQIGEKEGKVNPNFSNPEWLHVEFFDGTTKRIEAKSFEG